MLTHAHISDPLFRCVAGHPHHPQQARNPRTAWAERARASGTLDRGLFKEFLEGSDGLSEFLQTFSTLQ